jgi:ABC-type amino acid transport substrate-binding protein
VAELELTGQGMRRNTWQFRVASIVVGALAIALVSGLVFWLRDRGGSQTYVGGADAQLASQSVLAWVCGTDACSVTSLKRQQGSIWRLTLARPAGHFSCFVLDLSQFRLVLNGPVVGASPVQCTNLALQEPNVLTVAADIPPSALEAPATPDQRFMVGALSAVRRELGVPGLQLVAPSAARVPAAADAQLSFGNGTTTSTLTTRPLAHIRFVVLAPPFTVLRHQADLAKLRRVGVYGTYANEFVQGIPSLKAVPYVDLGKAQADLVSGRTNAVITDVGTATAAVASTTSFVIVAAFPAEGAAFRLVTDTPTLRGALDRAIGRLQARGALRRLELQVYPALEVPTIR